MDQEHVILRNIDVNAVALIEVTDIGSFTQTGLGRPFRKLRSDDRPMGIFPGETLWVAQSGRGVVAECEVTSLQPTVRISSLEDLERLRASKRFSLAPEYWDEQRGRLMQRDPQAPKVLFFNEIDYRCRRRLPPGEIFPLKLPRGAQNSWHTFDPSKPDGILAYRGAPQVTGTAEDLGRYGAITNKVRNLVFQIWGTSAPIPPKVGESVEYDHWIPKALGGPGIFAENVVPLPKGVNIRKSASVGQGFFKVSQKAKLLLPEDGMLDWQLFPESGAGRSDKVNAVKRVTEQVRSWPVERQKSFYFHVMAYTIQDLAERYKRAGIPVPEAL